MTRNLSPRLREVAQLVLSGLRTREIAAELGLDRRTLATYVCRICRRTGTHDIVALAAWMKQKEPGCDSDEGAHPGCY